MNHVQIVWFKRDLRVFDHEALCRAQKKGPTLLLYVIEKDFWCEPDVSARQYAFLLECLADLEEQIAQLGATLVVKVGHIISVLDELNSQLDIESIWSHEETWNDWVLSRNMHVNQWCLDHSISWHEISQNGVIKDLEDRDGWSKHWYALMNRKIIDSPKKIMGVSLPSDDIPSSDDIGMKQDDCPGRQKGGRERGLSCLRSFLETRGKQYSKEMSSPVTAFESCSRISPHISFGTLSIREVYQATKAKSDYVKSISAVERTGWPTSLRSFSSRLRWHCHFIQKLSDEPRIEFENLHSAYDNIRDVDNSKYFEAWKQGMTGYPMIDACMRSLHHTGWINFRMRAMLVSFASYHLWLDWRAPSLYLARQFTDYEPGIHYNQFQMQSGTTGINTLRIYNPIKQSQDHDPEGEFIRKWILELKDMPLEFIHTPWECMEHLNGYPLPIVDEKTAREHAKQILYAIRGQANHKVQAKAIYKKHGSRRKIAQKRKESHKDK